MENESTGIVQVMENKNAGGVTDGYQVHATMGGFVLGWIF